MAGKRVNITDELMASLTEATEIVARDREPARAWHPPALVDVRAIRQGLGLSQATFAWRFGFSPGAVREWEQGRRQPEAAARVLLLVIARSPEAVDEAIQAGMPVAAA